MRGHIPPILGKLANLEVLYLDFNLISGTIPPELGDLTSLQRLDLSFSELSGALPRSLMKLHLNLFHFYLTHLCEPSDDAFQAWLASIPDLGRTGVTCRYALYLPLIFNQRPATDTPEEDRVLVSDMTTRVP